MRKFDILFDLDSIVVDTMPAWLRRVFYNTGVLAELSDIRDWKMSNNEPYKHLKDEDILSVLDEPGFNLELPPMPGAIQVLEQLHDDGHQIYFVTARTGLNCMVETLQWMKTHLPWVNLEKQLVFCHDKWKFKCDIAVDDRSETLRRYRQHHPGAHLITIRYPYNRDLDLSLGVMEFDYNSTAWRRIYDYIDLLSEV